MVCLFRLRQYNLSQTSLHSELSENAVFIEKNFNCKNFNCKNFTDILYLHKEVNGNVKYIRVDCIFYATPLLT